MQGCNQRPKYVGEMDIIHRWKNGKGAAEKSAVT